MMRRHFSVLLLTAAVLSGCGSSQPLAIQSDPADVITFAVVTDSLGEDAAMVQMVAPYAAEMIAQISEVVGRAEVEIREGQPEGPLGTFAAEAMLSVVQGLTDRPVDMALTNNGGLRVPIGPGEITVGKMFELMPFDNMMIVLDLSAGQVNELAQTLANRGGDPIAGFSFAINADDTAVDIQVGGENLDPNRTYRLVTSDYLANGGGPYEVLWEAKTRDEVAYLLRDAFIEHLRAIGVVENRTDGLIRRVQ
ncbi:MAG: 2',3'-cyclic-nucleotide 2'-phosphodiesterase (5'-nucleotidase family) [Rhodothermales bacterium]|jgi:2',3'-cyclic-nucleotide 2'-phosphodiesterase (5'-nucleotidase family)